MSKIIIEGGNKLRGVIQISGAKNSVVALVPAAILSKGETIIYNVPKIRDIEYLIKILEYLECTVKLDEESGTMIINSSGCVNKPIPEELSREMRASYYFMGSMLARFGSVSISYPGGCSLGSRPIDIHMKGFESLGAIIEEQTDTIKISSITLKGTTITLPFPSVGATINLMLAATGAKGTTIIENAAKEPEIENIASLLITMGCIIEGAGTDTIKITGTKNLSNGSIEVIPDRIEAATYLIIGALLGERLVINGVVKEHLQAVLDKLKEAGVQFEELYNSIIINASKDLKSTDITTLVHPGFPTDVQQPFTILLTQATGTSHLKDTIFPERFKHVNYLNKMGADLTYEDNVLTINGPTPLHGADVYATDLRAGACLVIAGLISSGTTTIDNVYHILRGYEQLPEKLSKVGAKIRIVE